MAQQKSFFTDRPSMPGDFAEALASYAFQRGRADQLLAAYRAGRNHELQR